MDGIDLTKDMTTVLKNAAVVFTNQANIARAAAAACLVGLDDPPINGHPTTVWQRRQEANNYTAAAAVWTKRAKTAAAGNLLHSPSEHADLPYLNAYRELIGDCKASGRILITTDLDRALEPVLATPPPIATADPLSMPAAQEITFTSSSTKASPQSQGPRPSGPGKSGSGLDPSGRPTGY